MLKKPLIEEMCEGEIHDFLLELVTNVLRKLPDDNNSRRKELCQAICDANPKVGKQDSLKRDLQTVIRDWQGKPEQIEALEKLGFSCNKENKRKHYRVRWKDWRKYAGTLPASPSDHNAWKNTWSQLEKMFF